jgi:TRAP transporter 4TM/12TM fusion protein
MREEGRPGAVAAEAAAAPAGAPAEGLPPGFGPGLPGRAAFAIAVAFAAFQLYAAAYGALPSQVVRAMHVGFLLLLAFALIGNLRARTAAGRAWFWALGLAGFLTGVYNWVFYADLIRRSSFLTTPDLVVGAVLILLVFEAARRLIGLPLAIISGVFLAYCFFGQHLPGPLVHRGYAFAQIIEHMAFGTEGIYGTPVYVSAAYIFIFVVFAAFLEKAGMIAFFNDVALGLVGSWRGGPAQVCVLSSALMGTISGSGVANVVASGQFTIPLMKRFGFRPAFAGGVEATSSMGGQIMPPVMGAVAFIMAETIDVPYAEIVTAAIIPALLYFGACFWMVHLESGKFGLGGMDRAGLPDPVAAVRRHWPLVLPLAALVYLLFAGYTPIFAGTMGLALTVVLILATPIAALIGPMAFRLTFWLAVGLGPRPSCAGASMCSLR